VDFAGDSTGFSAGRFERWFDIKHNGIKAQHTWQKLHLTCGVKTNIVTAVVIEDKDAADTKQLPEMVKTTAQTFKVREFSLDKAYGSQSNCEAIDAVGGTPFIAFKSNATGAIGGLYEKMFHYFSFRRDDFLNHYHKRSNVESTVGMIKAKFRDHIRSKGDVAMKNEVLAKVVCHNICCLIQEMHELGIEPVFWAEKK
jgi:transposase